LPTLAVSDWIAIGSAAVSLIALVVALYAIGRSNRNSSVATLVTLNDGFRQAWQRYLTAAEVQKDHEFFELLNLLEIACGIHCEGSLTGVSRELSREYLDHVLLLIEQDDASRRRLMGAVHDTTTFKYILRYRARMRKRDRRRVLPL
jgi:hypothetical protein